MAPDLLIHNLEEVATPEGSSPLRGADQRRVRRIRGAEVVCRDGRIAFVGDPEERRRLFGDLHGAERLDGRGGTLIPGFVDPHTHLPWAGSREEEFAARLAGKTYQEIAAAGGGILSTVAATRRASEGELAGNVRRRMDQMLAWGTTTAEAKSGYGLSRDDELKQLRAIQRASESHPVDLVATLLAAHEVPPEHRQDRGRYLDLICGEIVPATAEAGLARFCDVFCEEGGFTAEESRRVLEAGVRHGLAPRLHADEFVDSGGAELAAELGALSADHLIAVSPAGVEALARSGVTAVLLPGTSFFLMKHRYAPARRLVEAGVPVALATDCNPGSSHTESMPMVVVLAVFELGLTIEESLTAATLNSACCLGLGTEIGSIENGKRADLVLLDAPNLLHLVYHYGINPVAAVVKGGRVVRRQVGVQSSKF
ncbi:MAG TPA: imidazolonepropionase [Thermoanaerobaculia bacterium]|jgi:imidazolonepropionase|nr:imidazolonepropionase [Thermoanaerobaculia bacterium]